MFENNCKRGNEDICGVTNNQNILNNFYLRKKDEIESEKPYGSNRWSNSCSNGLVTNNGTIVTVVARSLMCQGSLHRYVKKIKNKGFT